MIYEAAGMMSSLMATSFEAMVMDNEILGATQRTLRGIEVTDETLSYEVMEDVCLRGPNHYLGHTQTLQRMESEFLYPQVADRQSLSDWHAAGKPGIRDHARRKVTEILRQHFPQVERETLLRERFPLALPASAMRAETCRWAAR